MEQGDQSNNQAGTEANNDATAAPAQAVGRPPSRRRRNRPKKRESHKTSTSTICDHTSVGYEWLQPGWIAEVHTTKSGNTYKRYFDGNGRPYRTKKEVLNHYAEWERLCGNEDGEDGQAKNVDQSE